MIKLEKGFTLLELMISISLGLLIVAAGTAIFLSGQRSMNMQVGMGDVQQNAIFGLSILAHDLRHSNLNTVSDQQINNKIPGSGVVFKKENFPSNVSGISGLEANSVTIQNKNDDATQGKSDQLVIQFVPEYTVTSTTATVENPDQSSKDVTTVTSTGNLFDCEGNTIKFSVDNNDSTSLVTNTQSPNAVYPVIVQRYFVQKMPNDQQVTGQPDKYALYCDAGFYKPDSSTIEGLGQNAQQLMQNIEAFKIRFGVKAPNGKLRYMTVDQYNAIMPSTVVDQKDYYQIESIDIGLLARSSTSIGNQSSLNSQTEFNIAGTNVTLKVNTKNSQYIRQALSQVVAIRNTLGAAS